MRNVVASLVTGIILRHSVAQSLEVVKLSTKKQHFATNQEGELDNNKRKHTNNNNLEEGGTIIGHDKNKNHLGLELEEVILNNIDNTVAQKDGNNNNAYLQAGVLTSNVNCRDATVMQVGDIRYGNTADATSPEGNNVPTCDGAGATDTKYGVWYEVTGTGNMLRASTCNNFGTENFDSTIAVYTGSCLSLSCVVGGADNTDCAENPVAATVYWESRAFETYYILVYEYTAGDMGEFWLEVREETGCSGAISLNAYIDVAPRYDLIARQSGQVYTIETCLPAGSQESATRRGLWYTVTGDGKDFTLSTCRHANFDTVISVYTGGSTTDPCDSLVCVGGNDDDFDCTADSLRSTFTWSTEVFEEYYIFVYGFQPSNDFRDFYLDITSSDPAPPDRCENAYVLGDREYAEGTITRNNQGGFQPRCEDATAFSTGTAWYRVQANSVTNSASTCEGTYFDTQISVFRGSNCNSLQCVTGNNDYNGCGEFSQQSYVTWRASIGEEFYIVVHGYGTRVGSYRLGYNV